MFCVATMRQRPSILRTTRVPTLSRDGLAVFVVQHFAVDPEPRMQDGDVGCEKRHRHFRRPARAGAERAARAVQPRHQIAKAVARRGPGAVDGDELRIVGKRLRHAFGIVPVPRRVELVFKLADRSSSE